MNRTPCTQDGMKRARPSLQNGAKATANDRTIRTDGSRAPITAPMRADRSHEALLMRGKPWGDRAVRTDTPLASPRIAWAGSDAREQLPRHRLRSPSPARAMPFGSAAESNPTEGVPLSSDWASLGLSAGPLISLLDGNLRDSE
eukprot:3349328-Prymnesium_polylepis.2